MATATALLNWLELQAYGVRREAGLRVAAAMMEQMLRGMRAEGGRTMRRRHLVLTIGLIVMIAGVPLVAFAQTGGGTTTAPPPGATPPHPVSPGISPPPPAGSSTSQASGMASPRTPMIQADCTNGRWQQFGFPDEAACVNALPASPPSTR